MRCEGKFWLGSSDSESFQARSGALREEAVICDDFMAHFLGYFAIASHLDCPLLVVVLPGCSRLWFSAADNAMGPLLLRTLHRAPVGQGPSGPDWLAISFGFWSGRALATGTAWAGLCLIHHHRGLQSGPLLLRIRKQVFQQRGLQNLFSDQTIHLQFLFVVKK